MDKLWASASAILARDEEAIASRRGKSSKRNLANDHAMELSSCGLNLTSLRLGMEDEEIDFSSGMSETRMRENDHAVLANRCGLKSCIMGMDEADIDCHSGASFMLRLAKDHARFAICWEFVAPSRAHPRSFTKDGSFMTRNPSTDFAIR